MANTGFERDLLYSVGRINTFRAVRDQAPWLRGTQPTYVEEVRHNRSVHVVSQKGGSVMFARVTQLAVSPERLEQGHRAIEEHLIPALLMQVGYSGGLMLANPESGKMLAVTLWEDEQLMHATDEAAHWFRIFGAEAVEGTVTDVETYEVYRARVDHPQQ